MAKQIDIQVKETERDLLAAKRNTKSTLVKARIKALLLIKQRKCIYPKDVAAKTGYSRKTIYNWLNIYKEGGFSELSSVNSGGNNTQLLTTQTKQRIDALLKDPFSTIVSYVELLAILKEDQANLTYNSVYQHCKKYHKSKLKVARKSHHKKDEQAVVAFKKTA